MVKNLYFGNMYHKELKAENITEKEAFAKMRELCDSVDFKIYYIRSWTGSEQKETEKTYDIGSHIYFFYWEG